MFYRSLHYAVLLLAATAVFSCGWLPQAQAAHHYGGQAMKAATHHQHTAHLAQKPPLPPRPARVESAADGDAIPPKVVHAIQTAHQRVQADPVLLLAIAWQESRFDPQARNRHSSARGLLQFTTTTWLTAVRDFGAQDGLAQYAAAIRTGRDGALFVKTPRMRRAILTLRDNPELEAVLAAQQLAEERKSLEAQIHRPAETADLYLLHLLGLAGAVDFLTRLADKPDTSSLDVIGNVLKPNRSLFVHDGHTLSVAEAYDSLRNKLETQADRNALRLASAS